MKNNKLLAGVIIVIGLIGGLLMLKNFKGNKQIKQVITDTKIVRQVNLASDFKGAKVAKKDLLQGCSGQDCIPSIDEPVFESAESAKQWLNENDRVFVVNYEGVVRAYPQRILNWHEIVNDQFGDKPVAITFCPLCGSAVGFVREVNGIETEFGVSGKLHNSDLVMYDRYEGNLWQQITGEAIVGPAARRDETLTQIPIITTTWALWLKEHPQTEVLSRKTGFSRNYDQYPYGTYEQDGELYFGVENLNKNLPLKTPVLGVEIEGQAKAYPETAFDDSPVINDKLGNVSIKLSKQNSGEIKVVRTDTGEEIIPVRLFWFAWASFHPETEIYQ